MLHRRSMIKIPVPHFVTFYNGLEKWIEDEEEIRLSDMYEIPSDETISKCIITKEAVEGSAKPLLEYRTDAVKKAQ